MWSCTQSGACGIALYVFDSIVCVCQAAKVCACILFPVQHHLHVVRLHAHAMMDTVAPDRTLCCASYRVTAKEQPPGTYQAPSQLQHSHPRLPLIHCFAQCQLHAHATLFWASAHMLRGTCAVHHAGLTAKEQQPFSWCVPVALLSFSA